MNDVYFLLLESVMPAGKAAPKSPLLRTRNGRVGMRRSRHQATSQDNCPEPAGEPERERPARAGQSSQFHRMPLNPALAFCAGEIQQAGEGGKG